MRPRLRKFLPIVLLALTVQILAALGGEFKAVLDRVCCRHARRVVMEIFPDILKNKYLEKKSRAISPAPKIVSTLFPRKILDLILIDGATLLVRARAPPETWTTRL